MSFGNIEKLEVFVCMQVVDVYINEAPVFQFETKNLYASWVDIFVITGLMKGILNYELREN